MDVIRRTLITAVILAPGLVLAEAVERPSYTRRAPQTERAVPDAPTDIELPQALRLARTRTAAGADSRPGPALAPVLRAAALAGRWAAEERVEAFGRREYYRVGFHEGLRAARRAPGLGDRDRIVGERDGWFDPEARRLGVREGAVRAETLALADAEEQVAFQFADLGRDPERDPRPRVPTFRSPDLRWSEPTLREVFEDHGRYATARIGDRYDLYLGGWDRAPWDLWECDDLTEFFRTDWHDPTAAFADWVEDRRRSAVYRALETADARRRFRSAFEEAYEEELVHHRSRSLERLHRLGVEDGWIYGARMRAELAFRIGYDVGFRRAVAESAETAFARAYPVAYVEAYRDAFRTWETQPMPEIRDVALRDANGDGVFEPGESIVVEYELANLGGRAGRYAFAVAGRGLVRSSSVDVDLPARDVFVPRRPLEIRLDAAVPARTTIPLEFRLGPARRTVDVAVRYPLQFEGDAWLARRNDLAGEVALEVRVTNLGSVAREAVVLLRSPTRPGAPLTARLEPIAGGDVRSAHFDLDGFRTVDLIGGEVRFEAEVVSAGRTFDRAEHRLRETARDLDNPDLLRLLVRQATSPSAPYPEIDAARALLVRRLEADWQSAVRDSGNPYKRDFKRGGSETALGELVQTYRRERRRIVREDVFAGVGSDVAALSREMPGVHPFLRKYARKLASDLP